MIKSLLAAALWALLGFMRTLTLRSEPEPPAAGTGGAIG
jgi:hypothetical protein